ncbi:hypothetical protein SSX86_031451 [Deinandra increscens subsp. villosa]|uniref:Uncharacterized protein n=1 Tax=Deinandra increscens subsp. villosa TaxID=3103831 RepID=A0AAP0C9V5_9ASTR
MGNPNQSSDQSPIHENVNQPPSATRSYVPENMPPPEAYPPEKPAPYPPAATYPPPQTQPQPVQYPPPQPQPVQYPPPQPQPQPVQYPPPQPQNVYVQQPQVKYQAQGMAIGSQYLAPTQDWSINNGLFDCANDPENAIITACFPCITFGQIAEIVDNGQTSCSTSGLIYCLIASFIGIPCIMSCTYRTKIRNRYGLMETPAPDWVTHCFCEWCALCQEYRELKIRGLDPAIGWQGNMMRNQQQYPAMTPPMNQTMM